MIRDCDCRALQHQDKFSEVGNQDLPFRSVGKADKRDIVMQQITFADQDPTRNLDTLTLAASRMPRDGKATILRFELFKNDLTIPESGLF
jgi:hypothetical protein